MHKHQISLLKGVVLLILAGNASAFAQDATGTGPTWLWSLQRPESFPRAPAPPPVAVTEADTITVGSVKPARQAPSSLLRRLPASLQGLRIEGENGVVESALFLSAAQVGSPARFQIAYQSALSILPEASSLTVAINDRMIGTTSIKSPAGKTRLDFEIPAGLLVAGFNAVRITVDQRHRADCSVGATFELWTHIDRSQTGIVFADAEKASVIDRLDNLPAAGVRFDGAMPIRIVLGGKMTREMTEQLIGAAQKIALLSKAQQPVFDFGAVSDDPDGINLVVGTRAELPSLLGTASIPDTNIADISFAPDRSGSRPILIVTGNSQEELANALAKLRSTVTSISPIGSPAGLTALARASGYRATGREEAVSFAALGLMEAPFTGRFYRFDFQLEMPSDFLPVDYDRVVLDLSGAYGRDLTSDARIAIEVNGNNAATAALPRKADGKFEQNRIFFPLSRLRPGVNTLSVVAELPRASDFHCESSDAGAADMRFMLSGASQIILPNVARIGRTPDLTLTLNRGAMAADSGQLPTLYVPAPDPQAMSAAVTLVSRMAVAQSKVSNFHFSATAPQAGTSNVILVAPAKMLDPAVMRSVGLDPDQVRSSWEKMAARVTEVKLPSNGFDVSTAMFSSANFDSDDCPRPANEMVMARAKQLSVQNDDLTGSIPSTSSSLKWLTGGLTGALRRTAGSWYAENRHLDVEDRTALVFVEGRRLDSSDKWTIVTAPTPVMLQKSVECAITPQRWPLLHGKQATMDSYGRVQAIESEKVSYLATEDFSFVNSRLVFAGWLSQNSNVYILAMLLVAGCLGCATSTLLKNVGRRQK